MGLYGRRLHNLIVDAFVHIEIRDSERADFSLSVCLFEVFPCADEVARRLMKIHKVDVVNAEPLKHFVDCGKRHALAVFARPEFARNPDFFSRNLGVFDRPSDSSLVKVGVSRVDVAVACIQRFHARVVADIIAPLRERAKPELRHLHSVA